MHQPCKSKKEASNKRSSQQTLDFFVKKAKVTSNSNANAVADSNGPSSSNNDLSDFNNLPFSTPSVDVVDDEPIMVTINSPANLHDQTNNCNENISNIGSCSSSSINTKCQVPDRPEISNCDILDIGNYIVHQRQSCQPYTDIMKLDLLQNCWKPSKDYIFPEAMEGKRKRKFQYSYLDDFKWLAYSQLPGNNGALCKYCVLFAPQNQKTHQCSLVNKPLCKWKKATEIFRAHDASNYHKAAEFNAFNFLDIMVGKTASISKQLDKQRTNIHARIRKGLVPIVKAIIFCGKQGLSLRGKSDNSVINPEINYFSNSERLGNFNAVLSLLCDADVTDLKDHLKHSPENAKFVTDKTQNELINICGQIIQERIISEIKESKYFSLLADGTTDVSNDEQFSLVIRYCCDYTIKEQFLTFINISCDATGNNLATIMLDQLKSWGLNPQYLRGQGYDGASNMSGRFKGAKTIIQQKYPKALYLHCGAHALNLVLCDSCEVNSFKNMFGTLNSVSIFFKESCKREKILTTLISEAENSKDIHFHTLTKLAPTRWSSRIKCLCAFEQLFPFIMLAFENIQNSCDSANSSKARCLFLAIQEFPFHIAFQVAKMILALTDDLNNLLQKREIDLLTAMQEVKDVLHLLKNYRENVDTFMKPLYDKASDLTSQYGIVPSVPRLISKQIHRSNYATSDTYEYYKLTTVIPFLDHMIISLQERFENSFDVVASSSQLLPCNIVNNSGFNANHLKVFYENDLPKCETFDMEIEKWRLRWSSVDKLERPKSLISALTRCPQDIFPNINALLSILVVLPISVAEAERSFSTLRRLKTYLRSTMEQERLVGLAMLSIHPELCLDPEEVLLKFEQAGGHRFFV